MFHDNDIRKNRTTCEHVTNDSIDTFSLFDRSINRGT